MIRMRWLSSFRRLCETARRLSLDDSRFPLYVYFVDPSLPHLLSLPWQLLPAPLEHAFILRRYDTGAISVTTMYKAAFPSATQEDEDREMKWIKSSFDMSGMNGSRTCAAVKLAGNW